MSNCTVWTGETVKLIQHMPRHMHMHTLRVSDMSVDTYVCYAMVSMSEVVVYPHSVT